MKLLFDGNIKTSWTTQDIYRASVITSVDCKRVYKNVYAKFDKSHFKSIWDMRQIEVTPQMRTEKEY